MSDNKNNMTEVTDTKSLYSTKHYDVFVGFSAEIGRHAYLIVNKDTGIIEQEVDMFPRAIDFIKQMDQHLAQELEPSDKPKPRILQ